MKLKLQGPSLALGGGLSIPYKCTEILQLIYERNLIELFPNFRSVLKIYMTLPSTSLEAERNFSKLSILKDKFRSTMLEKRLNYLTVVSIQNDITESLSYDEAIRECASKK
jgi:hypothetical protein